MEQKYRVCRIGANYNWYLRPDELFTVTVENAAAFSKKECDAIVKEFNEQSSKHIYISDPIN